MNLAVPSWSRQRWLLTILLAAPLLGLVGVVGSEIVPDGRIVYHLVAALNRGEIDARDRTISMLGTTADHYAECTAVTVGLGDPPGSLLRQALFSPASFGCVPAVDELSEFAATGVLIPQPDYMRYWHGYVVFTRPALAVFGLSGTRWLAIAILGIAVGGFARAVGRRFGVIAAALTVVPALLTTDMIAGGWSISQALGMATAWAAGWLVLEQTIREPTWRIAASAAALGGAINAYFDLMVAIPASLILCTVAAGAGDVRAAGGRAVPIDRDGDRRDRRRMGRRAGLDVGGEVGAGVAVRGPRPDRRQRPQPGRVPDRGRHEGVTGTRLTGFTKNVEYWWNQPLAPLVLLGVVATLGYALWRWFEGGHEREPELLGRIAACSRDHRRSVGRVVRHLEQPQPDPRLADVPLGGRRHRSGRRVRVRRRQPQFAAVSEPIGRYAHRHRR